jgi:hypothetical protein
MLLPASTLTTHVPFCWVAVVFPVIVAPDWLHDTPPSIHVTVNPNALMVEAGRVTRIV